MTQTKLARFSKLSMHFLRSVAESHFASDGTFKSAVDDVISLSFSGDLSLLCRQTICVLQKFSSHCQKPSKRVALLLTFWLLQELPNLFSLPSFSLLFRSHRLPHTIFLSARWPELALFPLCVCCVNVLQYLLARTLPGVSPLALVGSCCGGITGRRFRPKPVAAVGGRMTDENDWGRWKHQLASTLLWRVMTWI